MTSNKIALISSDIYDENRASELLPQGWTVVSDMTTRNNVVDFVYGDGKNNDSRLNIEAKLRCHISDDDLYDKTRLHQILMKEAPETICKTILVNHYTTIPEGSIWMMRANWGWSGKASFVVTNNQQLKEGYNKLMNHKNRYKVKVIISQYIMDPLLFKGYKFHLRLYVIVFVTNDMNANKAWMANKGKIVPASLPYKPDDWSNELIHDTHLARNPGLVSVYPDSLPEDDNKQIIQQSVKQCLSKVMNRMLKRLRIWPEVKYGFEVYGVDVMITDKLEPKIIEFNKYPSISNENDRFLEFVLPTAFSKVFGKCGDDNLVSII